MSREEAVDGLREFLRAVWKDNDEETALLLFRERARVARPRAQHDLEALDAVLADPPPDLIEIMQEDGWIFLEDEIDSETIVLRSFDEHAAWLRAMAARFRAAID